MPKVLCFCSYKGTRYCGWQRQKNGYAVQEAIESALSTALGQAVRIKGASRTDRGVHARRQAFCFDLKGKVPAPKLPYIVNRHLPEDIVVLKAEVVDDSFDAMLNATAKEYRYFVYKAPFADIYLDEFALRMERIDEVFFAKAAGLFIGRHDFARFICVCNPKKDPVRPSVRTIDDAGFVYSKRKGVGYFYFVSKGFHYKMVRRMVGFIIDAFWKGLSEEKMAGCINGRDIGLSWTTAPAKGLHLWNVEF